MKKKGMKHAVIGVGTIGYNRIQPAKNGHVGMVVLPREKWYKNTKTNKIFYKRDGYIYLPIVQISSTNIEIIRKKLHNAINDCLNAFISVNGDK
jgi:hypothetical protein